MLQCKHLKVLVLEILQRSGEERGIYSQVWLRFEIAPMKPSMSLTHGTGSCKIALQLYLLQGRNLLSVTVESITIPTRPAKKITGRNKICWKFVR